MIEALTCMKRAGADLIITYFAKRAAELLQSNALLAHAHIDTMTSEPELATAR
jgi:hypothetical protein